MRKIKALILIAMCIALCSIGIYALGETSGDKEKTVELIPPEVFEYTSIFSMFEYQWEKKYNKATEGTLTFESTQSQYRSSMSGDVWVFGLEYLESYNEVYEAWMIDSDTDYALSLGLFTVDYDGDQRFSFSHKGYVDEYDTFAISKEPFPDPDPRPNGEVVLVGYFDTTLLTKSSVSTGGQPTRGQYADYGELADQIE